MITRRLEAWVDAAGIERRAAREVSSVEPDTTLPALLRWRNGVVVACGMLGPWACAQDVVKPPRALRVIGEFDVGLGGNISALAFSGDGRLLAAGSQAGEVVVWQVDTGAEVARILAAREAPALAFAPDGKTLAVLERDLRTFAMPGGTVIATRERLFFDAPPVWSPSGEVVAVQATAESIALLAGTDLTEQRVIPLPEAGQIRRMTFAADGKSLAYAQRRRGLFRIDLVTGQSTLVAKGEVVGAVSFEADRWFVVHERGMEPAPGPTIQDLGRARDLVAAPAAGQFLVIARELTWRGCGGEVLCKLPRATDAAALRPSGDLAAVARGDAVELVARDGTVVRRLRGHRASPHQVVIAGDNRHVVASKWGIVAKNADAPEQNLFVFDVTTGERTADSLTPGPRSLRSVPASPDVLLSGEHNLLWSPRARRRTHDLGPGLLPSSPVWSPDARWLWMGRPRTVAPRGEFDRVFDLSTRVERSLPTPNGSEPLAWRPDGEALLLARQVHNSFGGGFATLFLTVGNEVRATASLQVTVRQAVWAPDARTITLATSAGILVLDAVDLVARAEGPRSSAWVRYLDADHVVCSDDNRVTVLRADSGEVVVQQTMRAGLGHAALFALSGPPGDASANGRIVAASDGVGVIVYEVLR